MIKHLKLSVLSVFILYFMTAVQAKDVKTDVNFTTEELALSINILNSIDLRGDEVSPFIDLKNLFVEEYKKLSSGKKKSADVNFTMPMARNFLFFMQRAKLKGAEAAIFNSISTKMVEAIKKETRN